MDREKKEKRQKVEHTVSEALTEGKMEAGEPERAALERLAPRYEIRQTVQLDPILAETRFIRSVAKEVDDRYDDYVARAEAAEARAEAKKARRRTAERTHSEGGETRPEAD